MEYLCYIIREQRLETVDILTTDDLEIVVRRQNLRMPPRPFGIVDGLYRLELVKVSIAGREAASPRFFIITSLMLRSVIWSEDN